MYIILFCFIAYKDLLFKNKNITTIRVPIKYVILYLLVQSHYVITR